MQLVRYAISLFAMIGPIVKETCKKLLKDNLVLGVILIVLLFVFFTIAYINAYFGIYILLAFVTGTAVPVILLANREKVWQLFERLKEICGWSNAPQVSITKCDTCDDIECQRHKAQEISREPWRGIIVDKELDDAVESFYTKILDNYVKSWFSEISKNEDFLYIIKVRLRLATCHLIKRIKTVDPAIVITNRLLPIAINHVELVKEMLDAGISMDKLPQTFVQNDRPVHPAVVNREAELDYLRSVAQTLIQRVFHSDDCNSVIFTTLIRELFACWALLPMMDAISDPNLINLMIVNATDGEDNLKLPQRSGERVEFLRNFVACVDEEANTTTTQGSSNDSHLKDPNQLFYFMQFMKKQGAIDVLRFYLDVENLNKELQDSRITTDPAKLSTLHKQSIKFLDDYRKLKMDDDCKAETLAEAYEHVRVSLVGKWRKEFRQTIDYFKLIYPNKEIPIDKAKGRAKEEKIEIKKPDESTGAISRLGTRLKDVLKGSVDNSPIEATEVPTVWDAFTEPQIATAVNPTIYGSVTQKLRKDRGQNLENFLSEFMKSIDEDYTDIGEDAVKAAEKRRRRGVDKEKEPPPPPPGPSLVFGDHFGLSRNHRNVETTSTVKVKGPSECFLYIIYKLLKFHMIVVRFILGCVCISKGTIDSLICYAINRLIAFGLYEPRLAMLIALLETKLFGAKTPDATADELLLRQKLARQRLDKLLRGTGALLDTLQSPALNKHLVYCLFDVVLGELYPDLEVSNDRK